eukprot:1388701-Pleurochrysis_carterae.AAC.1
MVSDLGASLSTVPKSPLATSNSTFGKLVSPNSCTPSFCGCSRYESASRDSCTPVCLSPGKEASKATLTVAESDGLRKSSPTSTVNGGVALRESVSGNADTLVSLRSSVSVGVGTSSSHGRLNQRVDKRGDDGGLDDWLGRLGLPRRRQAVQLLRDWARVGRDAAHEEGAYGSRLHEHLVRVDGEDGGWGGLDNLLTRLRLAPAVLEREVALAVAVRKVLAQLQAVERLGVVDGGTDAGGGERHGALGRVAHLHDELVGHAHRVVEVDGHLELLGLAGSERTRRLGQAKVGAVLAQQRSVLGRDERVVAKSERARHDLGKFGGAIARPARWVFIRARRKFRGAHKQLIKEAQHDAVGASVAKYGLAWSKGWSVK